MRYPGLAIIGSEKLSGMYGVNEGIIDGKGTGIRHLFYNGFEKDLIHTAITMVKDGDTIYYGNRKEKRSGHPHHMKPLWSKATDGYKYTDAFELDDMIKIDQAYSFGDSTIGFSCELENKSNIDKDLMVYAYVQVRPQKGFKAISDKEQIIISGDHCSIGISMEDATDIKVVEEGPTGFIYRTTSAVLYDEKFDGLEDASKGSMIGLLLGKRIKVSSNSKAKVQWAMVIGEDDNHLIDQLNLKTLEVDARDYWNNFVKEGHPVKSNQELVNRIAIKSAMTGGFVPADLTGHYYSDGMPSYYARDSLMVARAFLLSGHHKEAGQIMLYLKDRMRKESGEFYQRYNGLGLPSEGANNDVFHQLDSIGYFMRNIRDYYLKTGDLLVSQEEIGELMNALLKSEKKYGMVGPEGGVNEGVYGPGFITSSNMFIYGGVKAAIELLKDEVLIGELKSLLKDIYSGIQSTYLPDEGYQYGYVSYHDDLIKKYDTPQYFGLLYGFEDTEEMRKTHEVLLSDSIFFGEGIGYSEQAYHHGPWLFNTGACAEYAYLIGDNETYVKKKMWMSDHGNGYGLMPEAIDGDDENKSYINPLIWASAEYVSVCHIENQEK